MLTPAPRFLVVFALTFCVSNSVAWDIETEKTFFQDDVLSSESVMERNSVTKKRFRWPNNKVYYHIDQNMYTKHEKEVIKTSLKTFTSNTCLKMIEVPKVSPAPYFIFIRKAVGCYSDVGCLRRKFGQRMSLGNGCIEPMHVRHEFMHALGFQHEQNRPDRDSFVQIFFNNIQLRYNRSYQILDVDTLGEPYDYHSITHYKKFQCAINPSIPTMISRQDPLQEFGSDDLSPIDIKKINKFYECP